MLVNALFDLKPCPTTMNHQPQDSRRQAARKFVNALDELETVLTSSSSEPKDPAHPHTDQPSPASKAHLSADTAPRDQEDLGQLLDEAVKDIEQFMAAENDT